jgi:phosphoadenosine phosphosulfate reductase
VSSASAPFTAPGATAGATSGAAPGIVPQTAPVEERATPAPSADLHGHPVDGLDLDALNTLFEKSQPEQIVHWAAAHFGPGDLIMSSSFGADSAVLLHMANRAVPRIRVVMVDTGYLFPETHLFMEELRRRLDLNVWVYRTQNDPIAWLQHAGEGNPAWRKDIDACCAANKIEPFVRAMKQLRPRAWLRGVRRDQARTRQAMPFVEWDKRYGCYAVSPLLNWTPRDIHHYLKQHDLPYHPLREKNYVSIGCNPESCTLPIQLGDDPRSGRWSGQNKLECGINATNSLDSANL